MAVVSDAFVVGAQSWTTETCAGECRLLRVANGASGFEIKPQQKWLVTHYVGGTATKMEEEWRDIPIVSAE